MFSLTVSHCLVLLSGLALVQAQTYAPPYAQCGGDSYTGVVQCGKGYECTKVNSYYSQCTPIQPPCYGYCPPTVTSVTPTQTSAPTPTPTLGYDPVIGAPGKCAVRRKVETLQSTYPEQFNLFILALEAMMADPESQDLSWFGIGGIHSAPFKAWQQPSTGSNRGYCFHGTPVFGTWHRPYVLLLEQTLVRKAIAIANTFPTATRATYVAAAQQLRLPYWDWADPAGRSYFPPVTMQQTISVTRPSGPATIANPLYRYKFQNVASLPSQNFSGSYGIWPATLRWPTSAAVGATSQDGLGSAAMNAGFTARRAAVYAAITGNSLYNAFSSDIEVVHNDVHVQSGGTTPGVPQGHVGTVPWAGFDPLFWLHHCNVDRLVAMWQAVAPGAYLTPRWPGTNTYANVVSGSGYPEDTINTQLTPFRRSDGSFWTSDDVKDASSIWKYNYGYEEVPCGYTGDLKTFTRTRTNVLYGPNVIGPIVRDDIGIKCNIDAAELTGSWTLNYFLTPNPPNATNPIEWVRDQTRIGTTSAWGTPFERHGSMLYSTNLLLTDILVERKIDISRESALQYLSKNLKYTLSSGEDNTIGVPIQNLKTLRCSVYTTPVTYGPPADDTYTPIYSPPKYAPEVLYGQPGAVRDPKEMTYLELLDKTVVQIPATYK